MDPRQLLAQGRIRDAWKAAEALLDENPLAPQHTKRVWGVVIDICCRAIVREGEREHPDDCHGCAWCLLGTPQPFDLEKVKDHDQTTSSLAVGRLPHCPPPNPPPR